MRQIPLGEFTAKLGKKSVNTGAKYAEEKGYRIIMRDHHRFVEVPDDWGDAAATLSDDERWKKGRADTVELNLAERRGEIAKNLVSLFFDAFAYGLPYYKERLMECTSLTADDQKALDEGLERMKTEMRAYIRRALTPGEKAPEKDADA